MLCPPPLDAEMVLLGLVPAIEDAGDVIVGIGVLSARHDVEGVTVAVGLTTGGVDE